MTCDACGLVQKQTTPEWARTCEDIYSKYSIYHQGAGQEQKVRGVRRGRFVPRSELLADFLMESAALGSRGTVLDIGCGNGAFLRAFRGICPDWELAGAEANEIFRSDILAIAPGSKFFDLDELEANRTAFDVVALNHCLEHIPSPARYLGTVTRHLAKDAVLLIQVPDSELNPFDLIVADHASHFSKGSLRRVIEEAGLEIIALGNLVLAKEITALVRRPRTPVARMRASSGSGVDFAAKHLTWIGALLEQAKALAARGPVGIFGSAIAGTWIGSQIDNLAFFVDEDEERIGRTNLGVPIYSPSEVPKGVAVLLALDPALAQALASRLIGAGLDIVLPAPRHGSLSS
jgi:SAM-dependent methyltransferase